VRDSALTQITGPVLVFARAKNGHESFFCAPCGMDFGTLDPEVAFKLFSEHQHKCPSNPKIKSDAQIP
jgi:hypothetical protein